MSRTRASLRRAIAGTGALVVLAPLAAGAATPNDPGYARQWGLQRMRAADAWLLTRGGGTPVAVIDTGVDTGHPDLRGQLLRGRDFVDGDLDPTDETGHGTHVAGTVAAATGNRIGVASVAPGARILPVRVLGADGEGDAGIVAEGIRWAVDQGAKVVNLSLAQDDPGGLSLLGQNFFRDDRVDQAIRDAAGRGAVVVVAAGNNSQGGQPETAYDAAVPGVIVVGASTNSDRRAAYSNYGTGLDVLAPGGGSASDPQACPYDEKRADSAPDEGIVSTWWNPDPDLAPAQRHQYGVGCGTSMAVAHVSGLAALLMARGLSNGAVVKQILATAHDLGPAGRDDQTGFGRIDAFRALGSPAAPKVSPKPKSTAPAAPQGPIAQAGTPKAVSPKPSPSRVGSPPESEPSVAAPPAPASDRPDEPIATAAFLALAVAAAHAVRVAWGTRRR